MICTLLFCLLICSGAVTAQLCPSPTPQGCQCYSEGRVECLSPLPAFPDLSIYSNQNNNFLLKTLVIAPPENSTGNSFGGITDRQRAWNKWQNLTVVRSGVNSVEPGFFNTHELIFLNMSDNSLTSFSFAVGLTKLQTLDLSNNQLSALVAGQTQELRELYLAGNPNLHSQPGFSLGGAPLLRLLDLSASGLRRAFPGRDQYLKTALTGLSHLSDLDLSDNLIDRFDADTFGKTNGLVQLIILNINNNEIRQLGQQAFANMTLNELHLANNSKTTPMTIDPDAFGGMTRLFHLDLSGNSIETFPDYILSSSPIAASLQTLRLARNSPTRGQLPSTLIHNMTSLTVLDLSDMSLTMLPDNFFNDIQSRLTSLQLNGNNFGRLSAGMIDNITAAMNRGGSQWKLILPMDGWACNCSDDSEKLKTTLNLYRGNFCPNDTDSSCIRCADGTPVVDAPLCGASSGPNTGNPGGNQTVIIVVVVIVVVFILIVAGVLAFMWYRRRKAREASDTERNNKKGYDNNPARFDQTRYDHNQLGGDVYAEPQKPANGGYENPVMDQTGVSEEQLDLNPDQRLSAGGNSEPPLSPAPSDNPQHSPSGGTDHGHVHFDPVYENLPEKDTKQHSPVQPRLKEFPRREPPREPDSGATSPVPVYLPPGSGPAVAGYTQNPEPYNPSNNAYKNMGYDTAADSPRGGSPRLAQPRPSDTNSFQQYQDSTETGV